LLINKEQVKSYRDGLSPDTGTEFLHEDTSNRHSHFNIGRKQEGVISNSSNLFKNPHQAPRRVGGKVLLKLDLN